MAFTFAAFCYMLALLLTAALIFFAIWHVSKKHALSSTEAAGRLRRRASGSDRVVVERGEEVDTSGG